MKLPAYLIAAVEELHEALTANPYVNASLSVRVQDGKPVHVEIATTVKRKPEELAGTAGGENVKRQRYS